MVTKFVSKNTCAVSSIFREWMFSFGPGELILSKICSFYLIANVKYSLADNMGQD